MVGEPELTRWNLGFGSCTMAATWSGGTVAESCVMRWAAAEFWLLWSLSTVVRLESTPPPPPLPPPPLPLPKPRMFSVLPPDQYRFQPDDRRVLPWRSTLGARGRGWASATSGPKDTPHSSRVSMTGSEAPPITGPCSCGMGLLMVLLNALLYRLSIEFRFSLLFLRWIPWFCWLTRPMRSVVDEKELLDSCGWCPRKVPLAMAGAKLTLAYPYPPFSGDATPLERRLWPASTKSCRLRRCRMRMKSTTRRTARPAIEPWTMPWIVFSVWGDDESVATAAAELVALGAAVADVVPDADED